MWTWSTWFQWLCVNLASVFNATTIQCVTTVDPMEGYLQQEPMLRGKKLLVCQSPLRRLPATAENPTPGVVWCPDLSRNWMMVNIVPGQVVTNDGALALRIAAMQVQLPSAKGWGVKCVPYDTHPILVE